MQEINASIPVDKRLWEEDIAASRAHAAMLGAAGIIGTDDAVVIDRGLAQIAESDGSGGVGYDNSGILEPDEADEQPDAACDRGEQVGRNGGDDQLAYAGQGQQQEHDA